ncbi:hypothetical protein ACHHRT_11900 [Desulfurivibrio sp. D14AmB]|uniref:hypothetical protein n=1 Tax=Desulfurivibrio sp. D14AmB TaxID=3374370 RepID=UPI00376EA316
MKKILAAATALLALAAVESTQAATFELSLSDTSIQSRLAAPVIEDDHGSTEFNARLLYNDRKRLTLASAGVEFITQPLASGLGLGLGVEALAGRKKDTRANQDIYGLSVGARLYYYPAELAGWGFQAKLYYVPQITAFSDLDRLLETGARVGYAVSPTLEVFAEYQNIRADFDRLGKQTIDDNLRVGFAASF